MSPEVPVVSVVVPTYQQSAYIEQCLEGILMQRTSFPVEILVGDDESTDGTREICQRYAAQYPDRIQLILGSRKDVILINGKPSGRFNWMRLLRTARGKYIALCEGDDYWIDPLKLQRQVDILEGDPKASGTFHNAWVKHDESRRDRFINHGIKKDRFTLEDVIASEWFIATASILARAGSIRDALRGFDFAMTGDMILQLHIALAGDLVYYDQVCSVYRRHAGGLSDAYWESGAARPDAARIQFEQFRPNQVWLLWVFSEKLTAPAARAAIRKRISTMLRMSMQYKADALLGSRLMHLSELRSFMRECLGKARPADRSLDELRPDGELSALMDAASLDVWTGHALARGRMVKDTEGFRDLVKVCWDMYRKGLHSRKFLIQLMTGASRSALAGGKVG